MSCNGCRVLRKGCSDTCILRSSLQWIDSAEAQGHATVFVAKFFGRAGMISFINSVSESQRPALFQSLLYEACGRTVNPVYGAVGLLWSGNWSVCQAAVETVLKGGTLKPASNPNLGCAEQRHDPAAASMPMPPTYISVPSPPSTSQPTPNPYSNPKAINRPPFGSELNCYAEMDKSTGLLVATTKKRPRSSSSSPPPPPTPHLHHSQKSSGSMAADPEPYVSAMPPMEAAAPKKQGAAAIVVPVPRRVVPMSRHLQGAAISCASTGAMAASEGKQAGRRYEAHNLERKTGDDQEIRHGDASSAEGRRQAVELSLSLNLYQKEAEGQAASQRRREGEEAPRVPSPPCSISVNSEEGSVTTSVDTEEFPLSYCCVRPEEAWMGRKQAGEQRQLLNLLQF